MNDNDFNRMKDDLLSAYQKSIRELPFLIEPFKQEFISDLEDVKEKGKAGIAELNQKLDEINVKGKIIPVQDVCIQKIVS
jgi:ATP-dependent exoDNAse (exonuclease V) alpha subunit